MPVSAIFYLLDRAPSQFAALDIARIDFSRGSHAQHIGGRLVNSSLR